MLWAVIRTKQGREEPVVDKPARKTRGTNLQLFRVLGTSPETNPGGVPQARREEGQDLICHSSMFYMIEIKKLCIKGKTLQGV